MASLLARALMHTKHTYMPLSGEHSPTNTRESQQRTCPALRPRQDPGSICNVAQPLSRTLPPKNACKHSRERDTHAA